MIEVNGVVFRDPGVGRDLSPYLWTRLRWFMSDPRVAGKVWVVSGSRSFAQQLWLWTKWRAGVGGFNLAANPYRTIGVCGWAAPPFVARGSWHMVQESSDPQYAGAGAVDLGWERIDTAAMHAVAAEYGLRFPVPGEAWHAQAYNTAGMYPETIVPPSKGPLVSTFGNQTFECVFVDRNVIVLWRPLAGQDDHNFHLLTRDTLRTGSHRVGRVRDAFAGCVWGSIGELDVTVRRGGQEYHTVTLPVP